MKLIDRTILSNLFSNASLSERLRSHLLLHTSHNDKVQRLLIGLVKGSYVEPHFHELSHQWEMFIVMEGVIEVCLYNEFGEVKRKFMVGENTNCSVVEFSPGDIHSVECISEKALMMEVKEGPFDSNNAKSFPRW
ncbi:WbuC family cupin fold metalloprotein [Lelliottia sp. CFBP8978]|uniref:WbuC family cupin fold metalloprotein n=1 Tax=Lelliottia sp. CFBP8978 TaxID=3096522 RepID=UPI002A6B0420|nr:WbuC family cupin fold metalloprotein [Lelliottia sp. CFBP8978]MDY1036259.1 WbuC family cupin fold metalloprotein [Lelliottia sp. CFBP8978]